MAASRTQETEKGGLVNVLVKTKSSTTICKIFYFEYVTYARTRFVKGWIYTLPAIQHFSGIALWFKYYLDIFFFLVAPHLQALHHVLTQVPQN